MREAMSQFGQTLFGASGFIRWTLTPFVLIFAVFMPLALDGWTPTRVALMVGMELMCVALLAGFWLPARIGHWAFRGLAGMVFLAYAAYLVDEFLFTDTPFRISARRSDASPFNALLGFVAIGLPSLWFALRGRFGLREEPSEEQLTAEDQAYEERLLQPNWEFYEKHLGRPAPAALRELYADEELVTSGVLECGDGKVINGFVPLDEAALLDTREELGCDVVAFATSDCGDPIYLRPGVSEPDTVYVTYHDGGNTEVFARSVGEILQKVRRASRES